MKFRAYHVYLIAILIGALFFGWLDRSNPLGTLPENLQYLNEGWIGALFGIVVVGLIGGSILFSYYCIVYYRKTKVKKSYI